MKILHGHTSPTTAYQVDDYPYGFRLRCKIRYWLEHHPKFGTRLCSQTTNPKRETFAEKGDGNIVTVDFWNKTKCSTYAAIAGAMYLDDEEHVQWSGLSIYEETSKCQGWLDEFQEGLPEEVIKKVRLWIEEKQAYATGGKQAWFDLKIKREMEKAT